MAERSPSRRVYKDWQERSTHIRRIVREASKASNSGGDNDNFDVSEKVDSHVKGTGCTSPLEKFESNTSEFQREQFHNKDCGTADGQQAGRTIQIYY